MSALQLESLNSLKQQVLNFEANEIDLTNTPQQLIDEFGYACLANSLLYKETEVPKHNEEISQYIEANNFDTLYSLVNYINSLTNDIDKLFAIFSYEAKYIQFDTKAYFSGKSKETTLEEVFEKKSAISSGYVTFFLKMAEAVNVDKNRIDIKEYFNYSKEYGYDPINPPKEATQNHVSIYIKIDEVPFISDPTWAAGHISDKKKFEPDYNPQLFLIPLFKTLCDHYPCGESKKLLPFEFSFEDFLKACTVNPFNRTLKTESNPYVNFECKNGYVEQIYSCIRPVNNITMTLYRKNTKKFVEISSEGITSYEIIQPKLLKHPDRCRFRTNIALPEKGLYKVKLFLDSRCALTYYVNNLAESTISAPVIFNPFHDTKFIPIIPKRILSSVRHGVALIRFAVASERSTLLWDIKKLADQNSFNDDGEIINREYGRYIKLNIPFDETRYEDQLCITFPTDGRYVVLISLSNGVGSFGYYTKYYFDVTGSPSEPIIPVNPVNFLFNDRTFAQEKFVDGDENEILIQPSQNCYLVDTKEQTIQIKTKSKDDDIRLEFKHEEETVATPENDGQEGEFRRFKWSIPEDFGEYHLHGWVNDKFCINLTYIYRNGFLREPSQMENELLSQLKSKIDLDESKVVKRSQQDQEESKKSDDCDGKISSKCCLLI